jgi:hypothetical protein
MASIINDDFNQRKLWFNLQKWDLTRKSLEFTSKTWLINMDCSKFFPFHDEFLTCAYSIYSMMTMHIWIYIYIQYTHIYIHNVGKTIINHPPVITINRWYKPFSNGVVYGVLPTWNISLKPNQFHETSLDIFLHLDAQKKTKTHRVSLSGLNPWGVDPPNLEKAAVVAEQNSWWNPQSQIVDYMSH